MKIYIESADNPVATWEDNIQEMEERIQDLESRG